MKTAVLLNPASGHGRAGKLVPTIERLLRASDLDFDLIQSERPWHCSELAEAAAHRGVNVVVAAGGDGTVNETINGLMRARKDGTARPALGVLSLGTETLHLPSLLVSIMNGRRIGGGFWTAPNVSPEDGLFDLCIAEEVSRPRMLTLLPHFLKGTQATQPEIQMKQATRVIITATKGAMPIQADGEILDAACRQVSIEILPKQLEIIGVL